ncbi:MAG: ribosomal-processing cysteine protease Prp [Clostridiales bacterium]|nr:ribosomal-processing cysteine protease Prp [Clostridiales bacterium]
MIHIRYSEGREQLRLHMEGHAGYGPRGQDIVCAAASVLGETLALAAGGQPGCRSSRAAGRLEIVCPNTPEALIMFRMARAGFAALAAGYGAWVRMEEGEKHPIHQERRPLCKRPFQINRRSYKRLSESNGGQ